MRILYHHRVRSKDGQAVHIEELIGALRSLGHHVTVVSPPGFEQASFGGESALLSLMKRALPKAFYELLELAYNIPAFWRLRAALRMSHPDFIYERASLFLLAGILLGRWSRTPILLEVNSPLARERARYGGLGLFRLAHWLERWAWRNADCALPVTGVLADELHREGVARDRIAVIPNGIDPARFTLSEDREAAKRRLGLGGKTVLGFTGFVRSWHGLDGVLDLLARADTPAALHLLMIGDGPARSELEAQARRLGIGSRVSFIGVVERDAVAGHVQAFDIALQPKAVEYASPLKLFEYMMLGKAIIAPDQPNIREILDPNSALLFDPADPAAMSAAIIRLSSDPALRARLGSAAKRVITERRLTWRHNAETIISLASRRSRVNGQRD